MSVQVGGDLLTEDGALVRVLDVDLPRGRRIELVCGPVRVLLTADEAARLKLRLEAAIAGLRTVHRCEHGKLPILCRECLALAPGPDCITPILCRGRTSCPRERACSE